MAEITIDYDWGAVPTVRDFSRSTAFIKGVMGPYGSGKSSGCVMTLNNIAFRQAVTPGTNVRRTRLAAIRNTYSQLKDTVKKTFDEWLPYAKWKESEYTYYIEVDLPDKTTVKSEILLRALDRPDDIAKLLSMELTAAWVNEAREITLEVFNALQGRVGRYPKRMPEHNFRPTYSGVIMDTNPPDTDHWWYKFFEEATYPDGVFLNCNECGTRFDVGTTKGVCPNCGWKFSELYKQPSGRSKEAENLEHLDPNYYTRMMIGKDENFIKVYVDGEYGYIQDGKPVFPNFKDSVHVHPETLKPLKGSTIVIGMDFALNPAAALTQIDPRGRLLIIDELTSEFMSAEEFIATKLKPLLRSKYPTYDYLIVGDPAGAIRSQVDARTVYQELRKQGMKARPSRTNSIQARIGAVNAYLTRMIDGKAAFILSPDCKVLRKAMNGHYKFRRMRMSGERYTDAPDKNEFSHIADALQYACLEHELGSFGPGVASLVEQAQTGSTELPVAAWT